MKTLIQSKYFIGPDTRYALNHEILFFSLFNISLPQFNVIVPKTSVCPISEC